MTTRQDIEELVKAVGKTPGWDVSIGGRNHWRISNPGGNVITASMTPSNVNAKSRLEADLKRMGWNPDAAKHASDERAVANLEADREKNEAALAAAQARADRLAEIAMAADAVNRIATPTFIVSESPDILIPTPDGDDGSDLDDYPSEKVWVTQAMALVLLEHGVHRQRNLDKNHAAHLAQSMERGTWRHAADGITFDTCENMCSDGKIRGCVVNGRHRLYAVATGQQDKIKSFYPNGVPFRFTYDFPPDLAYIFDTNRTRTGADSLKVAGLDGWGTNEVAALRMALNFDQSFQPGGVKSWANWKSVFWDRGELTMYANGAYAGITTYGPLAYQAYHHARVVKTTTMALGFLLDRDNPEGGPAGSNEEFWAGVMGKVTLTPGDPRLAFMRFCMRGEGGRRGHAPGLLHLWHGLRRYADWQLGTFRDTSQTNASLPMFPVWRDGMKIIAGELRYDKRDPRANPQQDVIG